jgi:hypothetical protein
MLFKKLKIKDALWAKEDIMKKLLVVVMVAALLLMSGCTIRVLTIPILSIETPNVSTYTYVTAPGDIAARNYDNPPINPGIPWQYWYMLPAYPGQVFFYGRDGRHHAYRRR